MTPAAKRYWEGRTQLRDELRPLKFNGSMMNIELHTMDDPAANLASARERGFAFPRGGNGDTSRESLTYHQELGRVLGFTCTAMAKSSGRGVIGQVQAQIWYRPSYVRHGGETAITRTATKPKIEAKDLIHAHQESPRIAVSSLR